MADQTERLGIEFNTSYKGTGADRAKRAMQDVGRSTSKLSVEQGVAQHKSALLQQKLMELSRAVAENAKTVDQATKEYEEYQKELGTVAQETEKAGKSTGGFDAKLGALAGAGAFMAMNALQGLTRNVTAFVSESIDAASTMQETTSLLQNALGPAYEDYSAQLDSFAEAAKRSSVELEQGSSTIIAMTRSMGASSDQAAVMGIEFSKMAVDLGSYFNKSTEQVFLDFQSALAGSAETLQKYGIDAREGSLQQHALTMGFIDTLEPLDRLTRAQTLQNLVMTQASDAMGDAVKTSGSYENSQKGMQAAILDLKVAFGEILLPTITDVVQGIEGIVRGIEPFLKILKDEYGGLIKDMADTNREAAISIFDIVDEAARLNEIEFLTFRSQITGTSDDVVGARNQIVPALAEQATSFEQFFAALKSDELAGYETEMLDVVRGTRAWQESMRNAGREAVLLRTDTNEFLEVSEMYFDQVKIGMEREEERAIILGLLADRTTHLRVATEYLLAVEHTGVEAKQEQLSLLKYEADEKERLAIIDARLSDQAARSGRTLRRVITEGAGAHANAARAGKEHAAALKLVNDAMQVIGTAGQIFGEDLGFFNEEIEDLGPKLIVFGGRTADQNRILGEAEDRYDALGRQIVDVDIGLTGLGMTTDEQTEAIGKLVEEQELLNPLIEEFGSIQGKANLAIKEASVNQDALNEAFFKGIEVTQGNKGEVELLAVALGGMNAQQAAAYILQLDLAAGIGLVTDAYNDGLISAGEATAALVLLGTDGYGAVDALITRIEELDTTLDILASKSWHLKVYIDQYGHVIEEQADLFVDPLLNELDQAGIPAPSTGGSGDYTGSTPPGPPELQGGGHFVVPPGGAYPMIVHPGEPVDVWRTRAEREQAMGGRVIIESGAIVVNASPGQSPEEIANAVQAMIADETRMFAVSGAGGMGR